MDFRQYQELARKTSRFLVFQSKAEQELDKIMAVFGLVGETGEVVDLLKKVLFHGHPLDSQKLTKELGDVLWYVAELSSVFGLDLDVVATANIEKLRQRYPEGFSSENSVHRRCEKCADSGRISNDIPCDCDRGVT